jgi:hypothetical protein
LALIALGGLWFFSIGQRKALPVFPAMIHRDCAPWDGSAFTVSIPMEELVINISIYRSPAIMLPAAFSFPDDTGRVGNALLVLPVGSPELLTGKVSFQRVELEFQVEGKFDLATETGKQFKGRFKAEWDNEPVYCG